MPKAARKICLNIYSYYDTFLSSTAEWQWEEQKGEEECNIIKLPNIIIARVFCLIKCFWTSHSQKCKFSIWNSIALNHRLSENIQTHTYAHWDIPHCLRQNFGYFRFHSRDSTHFNVKMVCSTKRCENANCHRCWWWKSLTKCYCSLSRSLPLIDWHFFFQLPAITLIQIRLMPKYVNQQTQLSISTQHNTIQFMSPNERKKAAIESIEWT